MDIPVIVLFLGVVVMIITPILVLDLLRKLILKRFMKGVPEMLPDTNENVLPVSQLPAGMAVDQSMINQKPQVVQGAENIPPPSPVDGTTVQPIQTPPPPAATQGETTQK